MKFDAEVASQGAIMLAGWVACCCGVAEAGVLARAGVLAGALVAGALEARANEPAGAARLPELEAAFPHAAVPSPISAMAPSPAKIFVAFMTGCQPGFRP
jgi:hypothetical protein